MVASAPRYGGAIWLQCDLQCKTYRWHGQRAYGEAHTQPIPGWQQTGEGEREVKRALRRSLFKYQLHQDLELFERAYGYIRQY
jgi:hypothetical protein